MTKGIQVQNTSMLQQHINMFQMSELEEMGGKKALCGSLK